jgi:hypothetical protein
VKFPPFSALRTPISAMLSPILLVLSAKQIPVWSGEEKNVENFSAKKEKKKEFLVKIKRFAQRPHKEQRAGIMVYSWWVCQLLFVAKR